MTEIKKSNQTLIEKIRIISVKAFTVLFWGTMGVFFLNGIIEEIRKIFKGDLSYFEPLIPFILLFGLAYLVLRIAPNSTLLKVIMVFIVLLSFIFQLVNLRPY